MIDKVPYKDQLENLIHSMRSPLIVLTLAADNLMTLIKDENLTINPDKVDEYMESLDLIRSSTKRMNTYISNVDETLSNIKREGE